MTTKIPYNMLDPFAQTALSPFRNKLINAGFLVNQRVYVNGTNTTGANQYTRDRWRVATSGQNVSFANVGGVVTATCPAGGLEQVIEGIEIVTGGYALDWEGSATATVDGTPVSKGSVIGLTGGTNTTVRFSGGTLANPQLELSEYPTVFERRPFALELARCQRFYEKSFDMAQAPINGVDAVSVADINNTYLSNYGYLSAELGNIGAPIFFKVTKRIAPVMTAYGNSSGHWSLRGNTGDLIFGEVFWGRQNAQMAMPSMNVSSLETGYLGGHWTASAEF